MQAAVVGVLLGVAVALLLACALGVAVMRDGLQRLHFPSVAVGIPVLLIIVAVWIDEPAVQARTKVVLTGAVLLVMNAVLSNATARAIRIRNVGHWPPEPVERIEVVGRDAVAGTREAG